jgi:hypothetical protein
MNRPDEQMIKRRAAEILEESNAYPGMAKDRLLLIKRTAIKELVDKFADNAAIVEKYYPGYTKEDLLLLLREIPNPASGGMEWHL